MIKFRFINPLVLVFLVTLPCSGCARQSYCEFTPKSTSGNVVIPDGFGVNIHFTDARPGEMKMLAEGGFRWVRMDLKWDATEKERGRYDFSSYDRLMSALQSYNVQALFILDYGNPLYDNGAPPRTEVSRQAFARWAVAAARRFAGRGVLWEVYNEPNHSMFWPPQPDSQEYIALALAVGRAFREAVPDEKLIGPATSEIDFDFLKSCFKAGLLEYWSAVSIHPYRRKDPETAAQDYCRLREMIRTYAAVRTGGRSGSPAGQAGSDRVSEGKDIPIISSEWGYSAAWPDITEEKQGQLLARAWLTNVANNISLSIWYDWRDDGLDPNEPEHHFGTVSNFYHGARAQVYDPKSAYLAARTLTSFFRGYKFEKRLETGNAADYVLIFRKGGDLQIAAWTTSQDHNVLIPLNAGQYNSTRHTGENAGVVSARSNGVAITLNKSPVYLRRQ